MARIDHTTPAASRSVGHDLDRAGLPAAAQPLDWSDVVVVTVRGRVDGSACLWLHNRLVAGVRSVGHLVVDLSRVSSLGPVGLTVLVVVRAESVVKRCRLCVVVRSRLVRLPLVSAGLADDFDLHPDLVEALECSRSPAVPRLVNGRQPGDRR